LFLLPLLPYDDRMRDSNGNERDIWLLVDENGQRTLFRLVEVGKESDVVRLASELQAPTIVVDVAFPALPALDATPGGPRRSASSRLILLNVRTVSGNDANRVVIRRSSQDEVLKKSGAARGLQIDSRR
jgi:hypothetical protein